MELQGYRCAGCSMKVAVKYASKFRYCFYLGRYFCTGCHIDKTAIIPGRIIGKWDFSKYVTSAVKASMILYNMYCFFRYPVSCFSFTLLEKMLFDPLFNITDLNSVLYKRARGLDKVRTYRMQLYYIKDFIFLCRYADRLVYVNTSVFLHVLTIMICTLLLVKTIYSFTLIHILNRLKETLETMDAHIILKPDLYSIQNLVDVKNGELGKKLQNIIVACNKHIINCQVKR